MYLHWMEAMGIEYGIKESSQDVWNIMGRRRMLIRFRGQSC